MHVHRLHRSGYAPAHQVFNMNIHFIAHVPIEPPSIRFPAHIFLSFRAVYSLYIHVSAVLEHSESLEFLEFNFYFQGLNRMLQRRYR